jgi:hypothetical protein
MNQPKVQTEADDPPVEGGNPDAHPMPGMPHGIPEGTTEAEATAVPDSGRQATEVAPAEKQPGPK